MQKTAIEWTATYHPDGTATPGYSSNPIYAVDAATGKRGWSCTHISPGCDHCYSEALNRRWGNGHAYDKASEDATTWALNEAELRDILKKRITGVKVFVADMTDLFHVKVRREWLDKLFAVFALRPDLTFQLLTKRPERAVRYLNAPDTPSRIAEHVVSLAREQKFAGMPAVHNPLTFPLPNVWLGTSVEDQSVTYRIDSLLRCPAVVRFLSCEPLLGPLDLSRWLDPPHPDSPDPIAGAYRFRLDDCWFVQPPPNHFQRALPSPYAWRPEHHGLHWVIVGGESNGPAERRLVTHLGDRLSGELWTPTNRAKEWMRGIRDQCRASDVAFFLKQWGGPTPKAGGRKLDGQEWNQFPVAVMPA